MRIFDRLLFATAHRLRGSDSPRILERIAAEPFQEPDEVRHRQMAALRRLLEHCQAHVPYYRDLFRQLGLHVRDIRTKQDLSAIPVLTKDIVRDHEKDLVRDDVRLEDLSVHHSGGSTGVPLRFHRDRYYMDVSEAGTFRNFLQAGWQPGEMVAFFWGFDKRLASMGRGEFEVRQRLRRFYQFDPFRSGPEEMTLWVRNFRRIRPSIAHGYVSTIARFAEHIERIGASVRPLKGVFTTAEKLHQPQRATIERVFGCNVYDCYGSSEVQNIAAECPAGRMHVMADFVVLEAPEAQGPRPAPLVVTSLQNFAMPFVRYQNEDLGSLLDGTCACGRGFPLMDLRIGRTSDNFLLPGGQVVHGEFFTHLLYGSEGVLRFQFHQTTPADIQLLVQPGPGHVEARQQAIQRAVAEVQALDDRLNVTVSEVGEIPLSSAGKHRFTRSDVTEVRSN